MAVFIASTASLEPISVPAQSLSFGSRMDIAVGLRPSGVAAADFDRDGLMDLAVTNHGSGDVSILLGDGSGSFDEVDRVVIEAGPPSAVAAADLDRDGRARIDLVITSDIDSTVTVLLGNGDGTFQERSRTIVGDGPEGILITDLNGDERPDVVTADTFGDSVSVALGNGDGTLNRAFQIPVGQGPCGIASGDLNGDGNLDVVTTAQLEGVVVALIGDGSGSFITRCVGDCNRDAQVTVDELVRDVNIALGLMALECSAFDRNSDGLVTVDELVRAVNSALNGCTMDGFLAGESPAGLLVHDLDDDGIADVIVANEGSAFVSVLAGRGDGTLNTSQDFPLIEPSRALISADFNLDGEPDLISAQPLGDSISVLAGDGDMGFAPAVVIPVHDSPSGGLTCAGLAFGDFNGDGLPDVVTANDGSNDITVLLNQSDVPF